MQAEIASLGALTAFAAGTVSFMSPCVLPMVPAYLSYITGQSPRGRAGGAQRAESALLSLSFVLGFSAIFVALGASATALSRWLMQYRDAAAIGGGALVVLFGMVTLAGVGRFPFLRRDLHFHARVATGNPASAFVLGLAFGFGWTPCIGPILGVILTAAAVSESASAGVGLLGAYSAGLGVPFVLAAVFLHELSHRLRHARRAGPPLMVLAGLVMVAMGIAMMTGALTGLSYWLLERLPVLGRIG